MPSFLEELLNPTIRGDAGFLLPPGTGGMLGQPAASPAIPPEWQTDLAPKQKGPIEIDYSQGIPMPYRGSAPTTKELWDADLKDNNARNPIPPEKLASMVPQMQPQAPVPGLLGGNISAVPPGVGGNPMPAPAAPPALPAPIEVGAPPGTPRVASAASPEGGLEVGARSRTSPPPGPTGPLQLAPAEAEAPKGLLQRFDEGTVKNAPLLLALAAGFAGAPSFGTGMSRAFGNSAPYAESRSRRDEAQQQVNSSANATARALLLRGASMQDVQAAIRSPDLMKAMVQQYFTNESGKIQTANGRVFRVNNGKVELLADYSRDPNPKIEELTNDQGKVKRQWNDQTKTWEPIPGFEKPVLDEKDKRRLNVNDTTKLQEVGGKVQQVSSFASTFKDSHAGYGADFIGEAWNQAGRRLPESIAGKDTKEQATWWSNYNRYKNVVRNELFGSALTAPEKAAFDAADISPGMDPKTIRENLSYQRKVVSNAMLRSGQALIEQGYEPKVIAKAYGVEPDFFQRKIEDLAPGNTMGGQITIGNRKLDWKRVE